MLFQGKYRIKSARLPTWNYAGKGSYHVIINTKDRQRWFGDIRNGVLELSLAGLIVAAEWQKTPILRPYVELDEWVIMPDHFHAVVHINPEDEERVARELPYYQSQPSEDPPIARLLAKSLGSVLNQFKGKCTKEIRDLINPDFAWQPRFYDVIIRSQDQLDNARRYVHRNITAWAHKHHRPR